MATHSFNHIIKGPLTITKLFLFLNQTSVITVTLMCKSFGRHGRIMFGSGGKLQAIYFVWRA